MTSLEVFYKNCVLRNFAKFTGKHLCQSFLSDKVAGCVLNFTRKQTLAQVFSCKFSKIPKNTFSDRTPQEAPRLASYDYMCDKRETDSK